MSLLRLYWSSSLQQGRRNFGDWLSPLLCARLSGRAVEHARPNHCDLVGMGSILSKVKNHFWNRTVDIWGPGLIADTEPFRCPHRIHAVRGRLTACRIKNQTIAVLGDPGLLCGMLLPANGCLAKSCRVGLIPHYVDQDHPAIRSFLARHANARLISVFEEPVSFIQAVAQCEVVLSSSLHGLVTADALGVPNAWIRPSENVWGEDFKFHDYYSIYATVAPAPFPFDAKTTEAEVMRITEAYARPGLKQIQQRLLDSFPFLP